MYGMLNQHENVLKNDFLEVHIKIFKLNQRQAKTITKFDSLFVMSRILKTTEATHVNWIHLDKNGVVGNHQATMSQLLFIVEGEGWVKGDTDEYMKIYRGDIVFWEKDEWHETKTEHGVTAIIIESAELSRSEDLTRSGCNIITK